MADPLEVLRSLTENVKVNSMQRVERGGQFYYQKRRRLAARFILPVANAFFAAAGAPLRATLEDAVWQQWGVECFTGLHGAEGFTAQGEEPLVIACEELPGTNLTLYLDTGRLTPAMAAAAGRELRRAHAWHSPMLGAPWSHGDSHAGNFILEEAAGRARIIDFELMHVPTLPAALRQEDDLLGFLLDLVGRIDSALWLPCAEAFIQGYGPSPLLATLPASLQRGRSGFFAQLWRGVQTGFLNRAEYRKRVAQLLASPLLATAGRYAPVAPPPAAHDNAWVVATHSATGTPPSR